MLTKNELMLGTFVDDVYTAWDCLSYAAGKPLNAPTFNWIEAIIEAVEDDEDESIFYIEEEDGRVEDFCYPIGNGVYILVRVHELRHCLDCGVLVCTDEESSLEDSDTNRTYFDAVSKVDEFMERHHEE